MIPIKKVEELILKHKNLESELSSGNIDKKLFATKSKEYSDLNEIINQAKKYLNFEKNKKDLKKFDDGWLSPSYPPELGGRNADLFEQMVYLEELGRRHVTDRKSVV